MIPTANRTPRTISLQPMVNRMRFPVIVLSLAIAFAASTAQGALVLASAGMSIDGINLEVPVGYDSESELYGIGAWDPVEGDFTGFDYTAEDGTHVSISGVLDPDPSIGYGISVTDFGGPSIFGFFFSTPIIVGATPTTVDASVVGGLIDFTGNGVTITPTAAFLQIADVGAPTTNMGVNVGGPVSGGPGAPGAFYTYGAFIDGPQPGPAGPWTTLSVTVGFMLSGGQDIASLAGFAQIVEVPEPGSICMLAMGALGLLYFARRRRA